MRLGDPSWFFNRLMLWGAGLGFLTAALLAEMRDLGFFDGKTRDGSIGWGGYAFLFGIILLIWFHVAKSARDKTAKAETYKAYLDAQTRRAAAYHRAFASALDEDMHERANAKALLADEFREACEDEKLANRIYYAACKAAEREAN